MAKLSFNKLGLKMNQEIKIIEYNGQNIEVKQYLPVQDKLKLISNVINDSADENNFINWVKVDLFTALHIIEAYTNITFTDKQKEDPAKLYDIITSSGLYDLIKEQIPEEEYYGLTNDINISISEFCNYKNSIMGILEAVSSDYSNIDFDINNIMSQLKNSKDLELLKEIAPLLNPTGPIN